MNDKRFAYDFLFVIEVKNREFESCCLICYELQRRGYKVKLISTWDEAFYKHRRKKAKVIISWSMYNDRTFHYLSSFVYRCNKMVNMQWEQILTNSAFRDVSNDAFAGVHGKAKEVSHIAWGNDTKRRLIELYEVPEKKIFLTGDVTLDFYRAMFAPMIMNRDNLCDKYNIPKEKKIYLFISTFAMTEYPENATLSDGDKKFQIISIKSQKEILAWFDRILPKFSDGLIIYRPHPAERNNKLLRDYERKHKNFRIISTEVIRQWIIVADKIYTWMSTSIKEIYVAKKGCRVLRPFPVDKDEEAIIYNKTRFINNYADFERDFFIQGDFLSHFPIPSVIMDDFVFIPEKPSYVLVADCLEKVLNDPSYIIDFEYRHAIKKEIMRLYNNIIKPFLCCFCRINDRWKLPLGRRILNILDYYSYCLEMKNKNRFSKDEVDQMYQMFRGLLE